VLPNQGSQGCERVGMVVEFRKLSQVTEPVDSVKPASICQDPPEASDSDSDLHVLGFNGPLGRLAEVRQICQDSTPHLCRVGPQIRGSASISVGGEVAGVCLPELSSVTVGVELQGRIGACRVEQSEPATKRPLIDRGHHRLVHQTLQHIHDVQRINIVTCTHLLGGIQGESPRNTLSRSNKVRSARSRSR
jgi:hypothetical protein